MQIKRKFSIPSLIILVLSLSIGLVSCKDKVIKIEMASIDEKEIAALSNDTLTFGNFTIDEPISEGNLQVFLALDYEQGGFIYLHSYGRHRKRRQTRSNHSPRCNYSTKGKKRSLRKFLCRTG